MSGRRTPRREESFFGLHFDLHPGEKDTELGAELTGKLKQISISLYRFAQKHAESKGIILADTKFEFGLVADSIILIDEVLTPDTSRFWDMNAYEPGRSQDSFDKQPVRDWLIQSGWNKEPPAPILPPDVIKSTSMRYQQAYERLTGKELN